MHFILNPHDNPGDTEIAETNNLELVGDDGESKYRTTRFIILTSAKMKQNADQ